MTPKKLVKKSFTKKSENFSEPTQISIKKSLCTVDFKINSQNVCPIGQEEVKLHWLHLFDFSPLCVFICFLKVLWSDHAKSHWLHLFDFLKSPD